MLDLIDPRRQKIFCILKVWEIGQKHVPGGNLGQKFDFRGSQPPTTPHSGGTRGPYPPGSALDSMHMVIYVIWCKNSISRGPDPLGPLFRGVPEVLTPQVLCFRQHIHGPTCNLVQRFDFWGSRLPGTPPSGGTGSPYPPGSVLDNIHTWSYR